VRPPFFPSTSVKNIYGNNGGRTRIGIAVRVEVFRTISPVISAR
jgi:hypothetical protein